MTVMARRYAILGPCGCNLFQFQPPELSTFIRHSRLDRSPAAATAIVIRSVRRHFNDIFFPDDRPDHIPQIFGDHIAQAFTDQVAGIMNRKFNLPTGVPFRTDGESTLPNPFGIIFDDAFELKPVGYVKPLQSGPDSIKLMPSLRIEPDTAPEFIHGPGFGAHDAFPAAFIGQKHAVVFRSPSLTAVSPGRTDPMQNLP